MILARPGATALPGIPVLAEEAARAATSRLWTARFILVDPLDGTREFLNRNGEFTVNIALIEDGVPVAGAVYAPALERLWLRRRDTRGRATIDARRDLPRGRRSPRDPGPARRRPTVYVALASRSHAMPTTEAFLARLPIGERRSAGSSLKFCAVAEGDADVYPRFGPTMEWDTAAGDAVLRAAGGVVLSVAGEPLRYGKTSADYRNGGFVAWGDPEAAVPPSPSLRTCNLR